MSKPFDLHVGINYSGAETPTSRMANLQVYAVVGGSGTESGDDARRSRGLHWNWTRQEIAEWLIGLANSRRRFYVGIDHAFSFPVGYFERYKLKDWE